MPAPKKPRTVKPPATKKKAPVKKVSKPVASGGLFINYTNPNAPKK